MPPAEPIWISLGEREPPRRRTIDGAIFIRFPATFRMLAGVTLRLPRRSRLRQALIRRAVLQSQGAWSRGDLELALTRYAPDAVLTADFRAGMRLDFEPTYRGREGVRAFMRTYQDAFAAITLSPKWIVDLGGNVSAMFLHHSVRGRSSGVEAEQVSASRLVLRNGLVVREEVHAAPGHDFEPLARAVGLDPADLAGR